MDVIALVPTIFRPDGLARVVDSLQKTSPARIVIAAEPDDIQAHEFARARGLALAVCSEKRRGCSYAWNAAFAVDTGADVYIIASDDAEFTDGWYEAAMAALEKLGGSGLVGFRSDVRADICMHYMMTRDFIIEHHGGVAAIPHYSAWCVDTEACDRAKKVKKFIMATDAMVIHHADYNDDDEGYRLGKERRKENKQLFYGRKAHGYPNDFEPILRKSEQ